MFSNYIFGLRLFKFRAPQLRNEYFSSFEKTSTLDNCDIKCT